MAAGLLQSLENDIIMQRNNGKAPIAAAHPTRIRASMGSGSQYHPKDIYSIYWTNPVCPSLEYPRRIADKNNQFTWMASIIDEGQPQ
ncbi:hypothetical protein HAX54_034351 [Datura stramonium]|uniref:Uncharacterized protein n=1 Tax=Datura stramonium TaxID=4076 RepID=A0ABS8VGN6_DATST|nr:hypothetical protein [Datura stramonium]